jgi:hypothetical protein
MDPANILDQLQKGLEHQYSSSQPDTNVVLAIRMLFIGIGAQTSATEIQLSRQQELNLPRMVYTLLGGREPEKLYAEINLPVSLKVLSSIRIFKDCFLDSGFINQQAQKWGLSLWLSMTVSSNL